MFELVERIPDPVKRRLIAVLPAPVWRRVRVFVHGQSAPQRAWRKARLLQLRWRVRRHGFRNGLRPLDHDGERYLAHVVSSFRSGDALAHHLALVADSLTRHGVPFAVLDAQPQRRRVIAVSRPNRAAALKALSSDLGGQAIYLAGVRERRIVAPTDIARARMHRRTNVVRVFQVLASASGTYLSGPDLGCDLEFWAETDQASPAAHNGEPIAAGSLIAPRRNRWADVVSPDDRRTVQHLVDGQLRPMLAATTQDHLFTVTEPIDVVYTWVDGSDPAWLERKSQALMDAGRGPLHATAANSSRFQSRDELKYSLRSLDMYADWVRHIYLVTDDQVPSWLDTDNPRITVLSHREVFGDRGRLPTFNSHAIETQLHRIEGLSEHYLYLNDDVFFGRPVSPELFVHSNGLSKFFMSHAKIGVGHAGGGDMPVMSAAKNNRDVLSKTFDRAVSNKFKHVPHSLRRSVMADMEREFATQFEQTAASQFRHHEDVSVSAALHHYYGYATGRAVPASIRYFYADIARDDTQYRLSILLDKRSYDCFCLNDHDSSNVDPAVQARMMGDFLQSYFPLPSRFERPK